MMNIQHIKYFVIQINQQLKEICNLKGQKRIKAKIKLSKHLPEYESKKSRIETIIIIAEINKIESKEQAEIINWDKN